MRTNLTDDHKIITLWPAESISRGDRSRLPFRRIWQSTRPNFSPCSQPQHFRTLQRIFSRESLQKAVPTEAAALASPPERLKPHAQYLVAVRLQSGQVARDRVILEICKRLV